jgi:hypothetical protein
VQATKASWVVKAQRQSFLTWALDECEVSASRPGRFGPAEYSNGTQRIGAWVGRTACLVALVKLGATKTQHTHEDIRQPFLRKGRVITLLVAVIVGQCVIVRLSASAVKCGSKGQM